MKLFKHNDKSSIYEEFNSNIDKANRVLDSLSQDISNIKNLQSAGYFNPADFKCKVLTYPIELMKIQLHMETLKYYL